MRYVHVAASIALLCCSMRPAAAQPHPRPFEAGYFPGLQAQQVVATLSGVEVIADPNVLTFYAPMDCCLARTLLLHNTNSVRVRASFEPSLPNMPNYQPMGFINHPQPGWLYLEPGDTQAIRLMYQIDTSAQFWTAGSDISSQFSVHFLIQAQGSADLLPFDVTLPADTIHVVGAAGPSFVDPAANATISGRLIDRAGVPVKGNGGEVVIRSGRATLAGNTDSNGGFSIGAYAFKRTGTTNWSEFTVNGHVSGGGSDPGRVVTPRTGQTVSVDVSIPSKSTATYQIAKTLDLDLDAEAWAASSDGSLFAVVPFHTGLSFAQIAPLAYLTVFNGSGDLLWRYPLGGETPTVDVSSNGGMIATTRHDVSISSSEFFGGTAIVLDQTGHLIMEFAPPVMQQWWGEFREPFVSVRLSQDRRFLAAADRTGGLWVVEVPSGRVVWSAFVGGQVRLLRFDDQDQRLLVSSGDDYLRAFDLQGNLLWKTYVDAWLTDMDVSAHYVLTTSKAGRGAMHLINKVTGATIWSYPTEERGAGVRIAPDESYVWYGTEIGSATNPLRSTAFDINGTPRFDNDMVALGASLTRDSQYLAISTGTGVALLDRSGHRLWQQEFISMVPSMGMNHLVWISPDASRIILSIGQSEDPFKSRVYVLTGTLSLAPSITTQPSNQKIWQGANGTFAVRASGTSTLTYQWQVSTNHGASWSNLADAAPYSGTTTATLTLTMAPADLNGYQYRAVVTNSLDQVTSSAATVTVSPFAAGVPLDQAVSLTLGSILISTYNPVTITALESNTNVYFVAKNNDTRPLTLQLTSWADILATGGHIFKFTGLEGQTGRPTNMALQPGETKTLNVFISSDINFLAGGIAQTSLPFRFNVLETGEYGAINLNVITDDAIMQLKRIASAAIAGRVVSSGGSPVAGALVSVALFNERLAQSVRTDVNGRYRLDVLSATDVRTILGPRPMPYASLDYFVTVEADGYSMSYRSGIAPATGQAAIVDVTLQSLASHASYTLAGELATNANFGYWWIRFAGTNNDRVVAVPGTHPFVPVLPAHIIAVDLAGKELWRVPTGDQCWGLDVSADGHLIAAGCNDSYVYLVSDTGQLIRKTFIGDRPGGNWVEDVRFSPDGKHLLVDGGGGAGGFTVLDVETGQATWNSAGRTPSTEATQADYRSRWSPDGSRIVVGSNGPLAMFTADGTLLWRTNMGESPLWLEIDSANNVYAAGKSQEMFSFDATGARRWSYRLAHTSNEAWKGLAADASIMMAPTFNGLLQAFDSQGQVLWQRFMPTPASVPHGTLLDFSAGTGHNAMSMTPSGDRIVEGSRAYQVAVYDRNGTTLWSHQASTYQSGFQGWNTYDGVNAVIVSPDGHYIAAGYADSVIRIFRAEGATVTANPADQSLSAGQNATFTVAATGNGVFSYQWQISTNGGTTWTNLTNAAPHSGVTTSTLVVSNVTLAMNAARYRVGVTDSSRTATSTAATLFVYGPMGATPTTLRFGAVKAGAGSAVASQTAAQTVTVTFAGAAGSWTATSTQTWLNITGGSGLAAGTFTVGIQNPADVIGASTLLEGSVTITSATATNSPLSIPVTLTVSRPGASSLPFGAFDTPADHATGLQGSFAVTGWALDDVGIDHVEIWRDLVNGEPADHAYTTDPAHPAHGKVFIAYPLFVTGSRTDVEALYPSSPFANRAGWGYLLLSWGLYGQGNGSYTLYAYAFDVDGHNALLGTRTIAVDNAHATKPFGAIDTPSYGGTMSGADWNFGWALTPNASAGDAGAAGAAATCTIINGSVTMHIDSGPAHGVNYGDLRADIAASFGGFSNGSNSGGASYLDTATLSNGTHQIGWLVYDNCGRGDGIGSRFFTVINGSAEAGASRQRAGLSASAQSATARPRHSSTSEVGEPGDPRLATVPHPVKRDATPQEPLTGLNIASRQSPSDGLRAGIPLGSPGSSPANVTKSADGSTSQVAGPVSVRQLGGEWQDLQPDSPGWHTIDVIQGGRIEVQLPIVADGGAYVARHEALGERRDLPLGSSFDAGASIFYWQPAPAFLGHFDLVFEAPDGRVLRIRVGVK